MSKNWNKNKLKLHTNLYNNITNKKANNKIIIIKKKLKSKLKI